MTTALLLVDLQHDFLDRDGLVPEKARIVECVSTWLARFRMAGLPVMHIRTQVKTDGSDRMPHWIERGIWQCVAGSHGAMPPPELVEQVGEPVLFKTFYSGFDEPTLDRTLRAMGVDTVVVAGLYTHACVRATALDAYARGYTVLVAADAVGSPEVEHAAISLEFLAARGSTMVDIGWAVSLIPDPPAVAASREAVWEHRNPAQCDVVLGEVPIMDAAAVRRVAAKLASERRAWARLPLGERKARLEAFGKHLESRRNAFIEAIVLDVGKPLTYAAAEFDYALKLLQHTLGTLTSEGETQAGHGYSVHYAALGTVGIITPWNNPLAIPIGKLAPALAWGNAVAWKPALPATRIARMVLKALHQAAPEAAADLVTGDASSGQFLLTHGGLDAATFTGSTRQGKVVAGLFRDRQKPLQAELGGNNAVIVAADADQSAVAATLTPALYGFAGQRCTAPRRLIVDASRRVEFEQALLAQIAGLPIGLPADPGVHVGPLVSRERQQLMASIVRESDGRLLYGGSVPAGFSEGAWFLPTLIGDPSPTSPVVVEESFGPIAVLMSCNGMEDALRLANSVRHGLVTSIFSEDETLISRVLENAESGIVAVNRAPVPIAAEAPFLGWKDSGIGLAEHGRWDRDFYAKPQARY